MADSSDWSEQPYDEGEELSRSVSFALLGVTCEQSSSFSPKSDTIVSDWDGWIEETFRTVIGPVFCQVYQLASESKLREVADLDRQLALKLVENVDDLRSGSTPFFEGKTEMKAHPDWGRYAQWVESGEAPGLLPVVFALHANLFRLPLSQALLAYAWHEWYTGHVRIEKSEFAGSVSQPSPAFAEVKSAISSLVSGNNDSTGDGEVGLRVV